MSRLGLHVTDGSRDGYGPYCYSIPAVVVAVNQGGALGQAKQNSGGRTVTVFRDTSVYLEAPPEWNQTKDMVALARLYYPILRAKWLQNPADFYQMTNELGGGEGPDVEANIIKLIAYEREVMRLANLDGLKVTVLNHAGGSPGDVSLWRRLCAPFILDAWQAGNAYARHAYGGGDLVEYLADKGTWRVVIGNPSRPIEESAYLYSIGGRGRIILSEVGIDGGMGWAGIDRFCLQLQKYEGFIRQDPLISCVAAWTAGDWQGANCQTALPRLGQYNLDNPTPPWTPPTTPVPSPLPKIVVVKKPSITEMTEAENQAVAAYAWSNYGRTSAHSLGDTLTIMGAGDPRTSYVVMAYPDRPSQVDAAAALAAMGYTWIPWPITQPPLPGNPLTGLRLGHILPYRYMLTSAFNSPRTYANLLHEGADYDVIGGQLDNKTNVLCTYPGTVDRSLKYGAYGEYVRVLHSRNGSPFYTRYCHLDARFVTVGQSLAMGQPVGEIGSTGNSFGEHVHFNLEVPGYGLRNYATDWVVDPEPYMALGRDALPPIPGSTAINLNHFVIADPACWRVVRSPSGNQEDVQDMVLSGGLFVRRKNNLAEWWRTDGEYYYLVHDTSPSPDSQGNERVYTLTKNGVVGAPMMPTLLALDQSWQESGTHFVQFRAKSNCRLLPENSGAAQNSVTLVRYERNFVFNRYGQNLMFDEVIWLRHKTETQIYGRKDGKPCGWIGWSAPWGETEPVELYWNRPPMPTEPNRYCSW